MAGTVSVPTSVCCLTVPKRAFSAKFELRTQMDIIVGPLCTAAWASPGLLSNLHGESETRDASLQGCGVAKKPQTYNASRRVAHNRSIISGGKQGNS